MEAGRVLVTIGIIGGSDHAGKPSRMWRAYTDHMDKSPAHDAAFMLKGLVLMVAVMAFFALVAVGDHVSRTGSG